jgi:hypothetical protein
VHRDRDGGLSTVRGPTRDGTSNRLDSKAVAAGRDRHPFNEETTMRVNVYAEEMTNRVTIVTKEVNGQVFTGLRIYLELPVTRGQMQVSGPFLHGDGDDDSSAVTFWGKSDLIPVLQQAINLLEFHYLQNPVLRG